MQNGKAAFGTPLWRFLTKLNILVPTPGIVLLGIYPKELETYIHREVYRSFIHNFGKPGGSQDALQWVNG